MPRTLRLYRQYAKDTGFWPDIPIILATVLKISGFRYRKLLPEPTEAFHETDIGKGA